MSVNFRKLCITASIVLACLTSNTFALDPVKSLSQYIHNVWITEEGLPQNAAFLIVQTGRLSLVWNARRTRAV